MHEHKFPRHCNVTEIYIYIFFSFFEEAIKISISNNAKYKVKTMIKSQSKNKIPFLNALFLKSGFQISRVFIANEKSTIFAHIEKKKNENAKANETRIFPRLRFQIKKRSEKERLQGFKAVFIGSGTKRGIRLSTLELHVVFPITRLVSRTLSFPFDLFSPSRPFVRAHLGPGIREPSEKGTRALEMALDCTFPASVAIRPIKTPIEIRIPSIFSREQFFSSLLCDYRNN